MTPGRLFAYGSLAAPEVMAALAGRRLEARPATLPGYRRLRVRDRPYPGIVPAAGASTPGVVWEGVDAATLALADRFEGALYERRCEPVRLDGGAAVSAQVYLVRPRHRGALGDEPWSEDAFRRRHLADYVAYCAALRRALGGPAALAAAAAGSRAP